MHLFRTTFVTTLIALGTISLATDLDTVTMSTTTQEQHAPGATAGDLEAIETWLFESQEWITLAWKLASEVRALYKAAMPTEDSFPSNLVPLETREAIDDLFAQTTVILEDWRGLSQDLAAQVALNQTDPYLLSLNQLLSSQVTTMNALSRMLRPVAFEERVNTMEFELSADIARLWQMVGAMLLRQLREIGPPHFGEALYL